MLAFDAREPAVVIVLVLIEADDDAAATMAAAAAWALIELWSMDDANPDPEGKIKLGIWNRCKASLNAEVELAPKACGWWWWWWWC